jgi:two-component system, OmpR family, KDP operon response regulator KdpE
MLAAAYSDLPQVPQNRAETGITRQVRVDGQEVHLTPTQYELLRVFVSNPDRVLTQRTLLTLTFGPPYEDAVDNLRTFVARLRRKVERDPARPQRIVTEPGLGTASAQRCESSSRARPSQRIDRARHQHQHGDQRHE